MKLLKYITTFVLLSAFLLALIMPAVLQLQRRYVQWEMMEALEVKELITIIVDADSIQWIETGKECVVNGEMFDVKEIKVNGDQLLLTGLFDQQEKAIKEHISNLTKKQNASKQHAATVKLFSISAYTCENIEVPTPVAVLVTPTFQLYSQTYHTPILSIDAPPPRC
jgi:hypothetical protein